MFPRDKYPRSTHPFNQPPSPHLFPHSTQSPASQPHPYEALQAHCSSHAYDFVHLSAAVPSNASCSSRCFISQEVPKFREPALSGVTQLLAEHFHVLLEALIPRNSIIVDQAALPFLPLFQALLVHLHAFLKEANIFGNFCRTLAQRSPRPVTA